MDSEETGIYKEQLLQVNQALLACPDGPEKEELINLKRNIEELLLLTTNDSGESDKPTTTSGESFSDEFALFMAEMEKEGAVSGSTSVNDDSSFDLDTFKNMEGTKCRAPHVHQWGDTAYHNAMICSVNPEKFNNEIMVRVLFVNPTHQEMLPCPYYYDSDCKFTEEKCRYSHGEMVSYSTLQEYVEPKFELLTRGSYVLAKQSNNLWYRAVVKKNYGEKCLVQFESNKKEVEVTLEHVFPLSGESEQKGYLSSDDDSDSTKLVNEEEDIINTSLLITPSSQALGDWERYTKGIGSKLMKKMGYIVGTGLGKNSEGRIDPVTAVILPRGKSLDHCMNLREQAGNDKNLFSVERKLKRIQRKQEMQSKKAYEKQSREVDMFNLINSAIGEGNSNTLSDRMEERKEIKKESSKSLNIKSLQIADSIKRIERDLEKLKESLSRHKDLNSNVHQKLKDKLVYRQDQLRMYQAKALVIKNEQSLRNNKKKMTVF